MKDTPKSTPRGDSRFQNEWLSDYEANSYLGNKNGVLRVKRCNGTSPIPYFKIGASVRYKKSDLDAYLESVRIDPREVERINHGRLVAES